MNVSDLFEVGTGEVLQRHRLYSLSRYNGTFYIDVSQIIIGSDPSSNGRWHTNLFFEHMVGDCQHLRLVGHHYTGYGATEQEALRDCLSKMKGVHTNTIIADIDPDE